MSTLAPPYFAFAIAFRSIPTALSTSFLQPIAQAKSPVTTSVRAILSRISIHLKDLDAGNGLETIDP